jgi:cytochrome bd ubiquinol oxidase subunit I
MVDDVAFWSRVQFGFTISFHYLFPQLTMGLAPFLVWWKWRALRTGDERYRTAARSWAVIFGLTFVVGVVTGIPMEFQFGTNWSGFSKYAGGVVGQTLAMEGMFAFFLESAFVGALVYGEKRLGPRAQLAVAVLVLLGSWLSGYFILATNAFMQHPVGYATAADGSLQVADFATYLLNPWTLVMYAHNMTAAVVTGAFVVAAVGAFHALRGMFTEQAVLYLSSGTALGLVAAVAVAFPTGDWQAKQVARDQEPALAAMEGRFDSGTAAAINLIGQPDVERRRIDNALPLPGALSFLATGSFHGEIHGLLAFPEDQWPTSIELLYYSFHIMVGLGTLFIVVMGLALVQRLRGRLLASRRLLWTIMLAVPFPYIATTAGWMTAELGRQPWLVYGLLRTVDGRSPLVPAGTALFSLLGFAGLYLVLGVLYLVLAGREIVRGPRRPPLGAGGGGAPGGGHG